MLKTRKLAALIILRVLCCIKSIYLTVHTFYTKPKIRNHFFYAVFSALLLIGSFLRTRNLTLLKNSFTEPDSYFFYRYAKYIIEHGSLMKLDLLRYSPLGHVPLPSERFFSGFFATTYKPLSWFGVSQLEWHMLYPVIICAISLVLFFFFVRELFGNKIALISTAFLAVVPAYLHRTSAGFADHEALAMLFMFASLWLFAKLQKAKITWKGLLFGALSGILAGLMAMTWGGHVFLTSSVCLFVIINVVLLKPKAPQLLAYSAWSVPVLAFLAHRCGGLKSSFYQTDALLVLFSLAFALIFVLLHKLKVDGRIRIALAAGIPLAIGITLIISLKLNLLYLLERLIHPTYSNRLALAVFENISPNLTGWWGSFGLTLLPFIFGLAFLIYITIKQSKIIDWKLLFLLIWSLFSLFIAHGALRLLFGLAPVVVVITGYFTVHFTMYIWKSKREKWWSAAVLTLILAISAFCSNIYASYKSNQTYTSEYDGPWKNAMDWVKNNTPENAVIATSWSNGYFIQAVAERATVTDGGNTQGWNHGFGRHYLFSEDLNKYLPYLKTHNVTHLLISERDILEIPLASRISSNENFDLETELGFFSMKDIEGYYKGSWKLDQNYSVFAKGSEISGISVAIINKEIHGADAYLGDALVPLGCLCLGGNCAERLGFPGCFIIIPFGNNSIGAGMLISGKIRSSNIIQLYLLNKKNEYFEEVYNDGVMLTGKGESEFQGPIRIWKVNYPDWVKPDKKYLAWSEYG